MSVSWKKSRKEFELYVSAPDGYALDVTLPDEVRGYGSITVNGESITGRRYEFKGLCSPVYIKAEK